MNCHDFQTRLASAIEAHGPSTPERMRLQQHVEQCSHDDCHQLWDNHELLARHMPSWTRDVPGVSLAGQVLTSLRSSDVRHTEPLSNREQRPSGLQSVPVPARASGDDLKLPRRQAHWLPLSAAVASLLLLVPVLRISETRVPEPVVQSQPSLQPSADDGPDVAQSAEEPVAVSEMIRTFAGVPQSASRFMSETIVFLDGTDADHPAPQPSGYAPWQGRLSEQWEPWGRELGTAFDAFLESLSEPPPPKSSQRNSMAGQGTPVAA